MKVISRPYQSTDDLYAIGKLIRRAYAGRPCLNTWSFCRFDIWAQRRIADAESFRDTGWQQNIRLWLGENGSLVGAAFAFEDHHWRKNPNPHALILADEYLDLAAEMITWAESRAVPEIEVMDGNTFLIDLLRERDYVRPADSLAVYEKGLAGTPVEPVNLPHGYRIKLLKRKDWIAYFVAVNAVFNMMDTVDAFRSVQQSSSNEPELHLDAVNDQDEIAAFCSAWWDRENNLAEFRPIGTVPRFQKLGLASALLTYAGNRLRELGCARVKVESWSESPAANRLYERCGLMERDRIYSWKK